MIVAILQARMSSTRLPGKVLKPILGKPMIERQIERLRLSNKIDRLVVATSNESGDDAISNYCQQINVGCYHGDLHNVLSRYYHAARAYQATTVVRLTADCPLADASVIDDVIEQHLTQGNDFTSNTKPSTFPDGLDVEVMQFSALEAAFKQTNDPFDCEHVTPYISKHPELFKIACHKHEPDLSHHRWTVDNREDFELVKFVYEQLYPQNPNFSTDDIYQLLERNPQVYDLNRHLKGT